MHISDIFHPEWCCTLLTLTMIMILIVVDVNTPVSLIYYVCCLEWCIR